MADKEKRAITVKKEEDMSEWYTQVIINSEFVDYSAVSGCVVFRPSAYFCWNAVKEATDAMFMKAGIKNAYFPLLIPERFFEKEKEHIAGFSPEVAWVTETGESKLSERLAIRPTSETIMYDSYSRWIRSWRDLPLRLNQWNSVIRWEFKHPTPLLRSREFLWNEGHTVFATEEEALAERDQILGIYEEVTREYLALPGILGKKTENEKFAGGEASYSIEHLLPNGYVIQGPDFHNDGQNFAKAFDIKFINKNNETEYAYQNTFAISTRELGAMVMMHGDNRGLVIPPRIAMVQVVIVPIYKENNKEQVLAYSKKIYDALKDNARVHLDNRDDYSAGWKFNEWELKGVPIRIEVGGREMESESVVLVTRHDMKKSSFGFSGISETVNDELNRMQKELYAKAIVSIKEKIKKVDNYEELKKAISGGNVAQAQWCGETPCELKIKEETGAKATNMPFDAQKDVKGNCVYCDKQSKHVVNFAKSY
ncbi:MAG: proline--tRNA ligase [Candidatus Marsarchaeota archaeon]|jgi:prolyl-tRNA synthetase|nr:proline--tRNA ligase [Candidatus Marsarchaeota archaeon]